MPVEALFDISEPGETRAKEACKGRAAGIDLGTTNSLVAVVQAGQPQCLPDADGDCIVPSAVYYGADGNVVVGRDARDRLAPVHPRDTIVSVKRFMGRGARDMGASPALVAHELAHHGDDDPVVRFVVAGRQRQVTPVEVSADILRVLKDRAEAAVGGALDGVVITVPAYFDDGQRQATRDAGRLAGLEVMRLLNEPTAAALAYGLDKQARGTFAVFDLGGGTFDISILALQDGVFEVKSTGGDSALGGDDFDHAIADHLVRQMRQAQPPAGDLTGADGGHFARAVLDAAKRAKEALTDTESTDVQVVLPDGRTWAGALSRSQMETLVTPVLDRCRFPVERALKDAGVASRDLDGVILVGGATRMILVRRFVESLFGRPPLADIDPDQVVALGAAVQADLLAGGDNPHDVILLDVVPLSLGLEMMGGVVEKVIHRNSTVPCGATQTFTTYADNQTGFDLHVVQGERELVGECRSLARFKLTGIPPAPAGLARLEVTFTVDADGILAVSARELGTGKEASIQVKPSYGLTDEEVERMLLDSFEHAEEDVLRRLLAEQRVEADRILNATQTALQATPELLQDGEQAAIDRAIADLVAASRDIDHRKIKAAIEALDAASKAFATRRMNKALEKGLAGQGVSQVERAVDQHAVKR